MSSYAGVRARTPVYFQSIWGSLASVWYILDITSPLWQFRQLIGTGKMFFTHMKNVKKMHGLRARTPVWFEYINGLLASVWYILVITRPLSQFRQFIGTGKSVLTKIKNVTNARTPGFYWHKYFHFSLSLDHNKILQRFFSYQGDVGNDGSY